MIYQPGQCNTLHPCADKGNALPGEKQTVIPVLQRPEHRFDLQRYITFQSPFQDDFKFSLNVIAFNIDQDHFVPLYPLINNYNTCTRYNIIIPTIVIEDTPTGNQTGAIHGLGIRKRTSMVFSDEGHFIKMYSET